MADKPLKPKEMALDGRLITAVDPTMIGSNFQELKNMRYTDTNPRAIKGMSKINTTALSSHPKISDGFHFKKEQPAESHVLVQSYNSGETESKVFENTTAIPNAGDFSATALHTDASGAGQGRFSDAPNGNVAYCNGAESLIWGGDEHFSSGFINFDIDDTFYGDYTHRVNNTLTDSENSAVIKKTSGDLPDGTVLLLHLDNNVTDSSPTTPHTVTNNNVTFTTSSKFGTHAATFVNTSNAYLTVPDDADFDFSGGNFTIDFWIKFTQPLGGGTQTLFSQATDANNYMRLHLTAVGVFLFEVVSAGSQVVARALTASGSPNLLTGEFHHMQITESGNNWYWFIDGVLNQYWSDTDRMANYTGDFHIGAFDAGGGATNFLHATIDEFKVSTSSLNANTFELRQVPYGTAASYVDIGAIRPIRGAKFYVKTANTTASSVEVFEWQRFDPPTTGTVLDDSGTTGVWTKTTTLSDGTASGGISLAQTGSVTFDDTKDTSSPRVRNNTYLYWYRFVFTDIDDTTDISQVTLDMSMQTIKDLWDGELRSPLYFGVNDGTTTYDNTINVFEGTYTSTNSATYSDLTGLAASGYLLVGFAERMVGLDIRFIPGKTNVDTGNPAGVNYYGPGDSSLVYLVKTGDYDNNAPFNKSGLISWTPPAPELESPQEIDGRPPLYYYKILPGALTAGTDTVHLYHIAGIPAQNTINGYKFPLLSHNRLMLGSNQDGDKNSVLIGAPNTTSIFNGDSHRKINFGNDDELVAGAEISGQFEADNYNFTLLCKKSESWLLSEQEDTFEWYRVSSTIGCTAPLTMTMVHTAPTENRPAINGAIFQSTDAIYLFDGKEFHPVHRDIEDVFTTLNKSYIDKSGGFLDEANQEWHWLITTGASTTHNEEWVYDLKRDKWYEIDRGSYLQSGFKVEDTTGNFYNYGTLDTGYMERLENGTTFDGSDMTFDLRVADMPLRDSIMYESQIRGVHLLAKAKNTTTNSVTVTHYGDTQTTGTTLTPISLANSSKRLSDRVKSVNTGKHVFHSLKLSMTTNNETIGFEPLQLGVFYKDMNEHKGIKNN